ncbi:MAG: DNA gyrase inhibitor YacG [Saccharospirillum sp.]
MSSPKVPCPTCRQAVVYSTRNPFRPFCSERCKLIDLGEWASEGHRIAGKPAVDELMSGELDGLVSRDE